MTTARQKIDLERLLSPQTGRSEEMQALWDWLVEIDKSGPDVSAMSVTDMRTHRTRQADRLMNVDLPEVESVTRVDVPGLYAAPPVPCDLIVPKDAKPGAVVYLHGGGWTFGNLVTHARLARMIAIETGRAVLAVDYRLAPEHPFPEPLDDCCAAWRWIVVESERNPALRGTLAICGDSAGANLAMATMLRESETGRRLPDVAMLWYGVYNDDVDTPSYQRFSAGYGLTRAGLAKFWDYYAPSAAHGHPRRDPLVCPVHASEAQLAKLPPLYLNASGLDPLLCDTVAMVERLEAAGCRVDVNIHEGLHHGFMQQTAKLAESRRAMKLMGDFFRAHARE